MVVHAHHAGSTCVAVHSDNTNVLILLSHSEGLGNCFIEKGKSSKSRIVQLSNVVDNLLKNLDRDVRLCDFLRSLIGLHSLTGCDTVAAFAGKGKCKALQLVLSNASYVRALLEIGGNLVLTEETMVTVEAFVCQLYGKEYVSVDVLRFELHCAKGGKVAPEVLPPRQSSLRLHVTRANYQVEGRLYSFA